MNYQHLFHSGNFADVCKHLSILLLLTHFKQKDNAFCYVETHAGAGLYDLHSDTAQHSAEYQHGIAQLWQQANKSPLLQNYCNIVAQFNAEKQLRYYPGSPCLVQTQLREQDRAILAELAPTVVQQLKHTVATDKRFAIHQLDGYQAIKAFLPPAEKRGLILIDPPYETGKDFSQIITSVQYLHKHWRQAVVAVWYPIKNRTDTAEFHQQVRTMGIHKILATELCIFPDDNALRLNGSGLLFFNPPWQFDNQMRQLFDELLPLLSQHPKRKASVTWLVPE